MHKTQGRTKFWWLLCGFGFASILALRALPLRALPQEVSRSQEGRSKTETSASEYRDWVKSLPSWPLSERFDDETSRVKVVVTAIEGDERNPDGREASPMFSNRISYGCQVSTGGRVHSFYQSARGTKGGGYPQISPQNLKRLDQLLTQLPDDGSVLPPAGRRLVVQVSDKNHFRVRVYDRANAPAPVIEVLRLSLSGIKSFLPEFQPATQWRAHEHGDGAFGLSPDGRHLVSTSLGDPFRFWHPDTHAMVREVKRPQDTAATGLVFSPDGSTAALGGWGEVSLIDTRTWRRLRQFAGPTIKGVGQSLSAPQFTPDGRFAASSAATETSVDLKNRITPLMEAMMGGEETTMRLRLKRGADVNALDSDGLTALDWAYNMSPSSPPTPQQRKFLDMIFRVLRQSGAKRSQDLKQRATQKQD